MSSSSRLSAARTVDTGEEISHCHMELLPIIFRLLELGVPTQSGHLSENATGLVPHGPFSTALRAQTGLKHLHIVPHTCTQPMYTYTCTHCTCIYCYKPAHSAIRLKTLIYTSVHTPVHMHTLTHTFTYTYMPLYILSHT